MEKKYRVLLFAFLCFFSLKNYAQSSDLGSTIEAEISKRFFKKLDLSISAEWRQREDLKEIDRYSFGGDIGYRFNSYLKIGAAYNYIQFNHNKKGWETRHRYHAYATGSYKYNRLKFSLRERFQSTYRVGVKETYKRANPKFIMRSKFEIDYNIRKSMFEPYVSAELYNTLNDPRKNYVDRLRYEVGTAIKLNKKNSFNVGYRYTDYAIPEDGDIVHCICIGYNFKL